MTPLVPTGPPVLAVPTPGAATGVAAADVAAADRGRRDQDPSMFYVLRRRA